MKHSKRFREVAAAFTQDTPHALEEAVRLVGTAPVKFDAGVELHMKLGIDPKKSEQAVRGTVFLPHGTGKHARVAAFVESDQEEEARNAGAEIVGGDDVIAAIKQTGKCAFDVAVATPAIMKKLGPIAKILGPLGLMPNPKTETVGSDIATMVGQLRSGKVAFRSDDGGNVHLLVGRVSFDAAKLTENITTAINAVVRAKPAESKGVYLRAITLASSMGPGVRVALP